MKKKSVDINVMMNLCVACVIKIYVEHVNLE